MSESTAGGNRLSFVVEWDASPVRERGFRTPGCLTSEDEERETWTAESLRISVIEGFGFRFRDRTKDFGGTRFKGYTIAARDVNRRRLSASADKNGGTSSNVVISRFKVSSPT